MRGLHVVVFGGLVGESRKQGVDREGARRALRQIGARVYEKDAQRLEKNGQPFWILGLGDQFAYYVGTPAGWAGSSRRPAR